MNRCALNFVLIVAALSLSACSDTASTTSTNNASAANIVKITAANYEAEVVQSDVPVLIDFWAPWCEPCLEIAPAIERMAKEHSGKLKVAKVNVDDNADLAQKFKVDSIPAIVLVKNGNEQQRVVGADESKIRQMVDQQLASSP